MKPGEENPGQVVVANTYLMYILILHKFTTCLGFSCVLYIFQVDG